MINEKELRDAVQVELDIAKQRSRKNWMISGAIVLVGTVIFGLGSPGGMGFFFAIGIGLIYLGLGEVFYVAPMRRQFEEKVMSIINDRVFSQYFTNAVYYRKDGFSQNVLQETGVIDFGNIYHTNDYLRGEYNGIDFERADVLSQQRTQTGKTTTTTTLFRGQVYIFDFHKPTKHYIRIRSRGDFFSGFSKGRKTDGATRIEFEDTDFNDRFHIFSNDEHEAFYVFTPHYMEKIKDFDSLVLSPMSLVIQDGRLIVALYTNRDSFETSLMRGIDDTFIENMEKDIKIISKIIDELDLDSELFEVRESKEETR